MTKEIELRARNVRILPRVQDVPAVGGRMPENGSRYQIWRDTNRNQLLARLASARGKGYVEQVTPMKRTQRGDFAMVVKVIRDAPSRTPWYISATVVSISASFAIGLAAWHARYVFLSLAGIIVGVPALYWLVSHFRVCPGLHCPCCKGR